MDMLFPPGTPVRVPVVAVAASADSAAICRIIAQAISDTGHTVGRSSREGVFIDGIHYRGVDGTNPVGPRAVLNNPLLEIAVVEVDAESIVTHGLGFDRCDVAVITALSGLLTPSGRPVESVLLGALDAQGCALFDRSNPQVAALAETSNGRIVPFSSDLDDAQLRTLLADCLRNIPQFG